MASFSCQIKSGLKGSAENHWEYIMRRGEHRARDEVLFSGYGNLPTWAEANPAYFFACSDKYERSNGTAYKELIIALPAEFPIKKLQILVVTTVNALIGLKPFQYAVHAPNSSLQGETNVHVHIMYSDRVEDGIDRSPEQMFSRYNAADPTRGGQRKDSGGKTNAELREKLIAKRKLVADIQNAHLAMNGYSERVDHRSLKEQGLTRIAEKHLGPSRIRTMSDKEKNEIIERRNLNNIG
jgi:hypothetical protein